MADSSASTPRGTRFSWRQLLLRLGLGTLLLGLIYTIFGLLAPFFFEDWLNQRLKQTFAAEGEGEFLYSAAELQFFGAFPFVGIQIENPRLIAWGVFQGDTLLKAESMELKTSPLNLFVEENIRISHISASNGRVNLRSLREGQLNWDYAPKGLLENLPLRSRKLEQTDFWLGLSEIEIDDFEFWLFERQKEFPSHIFFVEEAELNGDLFQPGQYAELEFEGNWQPENWLGFLPEERLQTSGDGLVRISPKGLSISLQDYQLKINGLEMILSGEARRREKGWNFDLRALNKNEDFRKLASVLPGFGGMEALEATGEGTFVFSAWLQGSLRDTVSPAYSLKLNFQDCRLKYDRLPGQLRELNGLIRIENPTGHPEDRQIAVRDLFTQLGNSTLEANFSWQEQAPRFLESRVSLRLDLAELIRCLPIDNYLMKGKLDVNLTAKGLLGRDTTPVFDFNTAFRFGFLKHRQAPRGIENITLLARGQNKTGSPSDTRLQLDNLFFELAAEPFEAKAAWQNEQTPAYRILAKGLLDLRILAEQLNPEFPRLRGKARFAIDQGAKLTPTPTDWQAAGVQQEFSLSGVQWFANVSDSLPTWELDSVHTSCTPQSWVVDTAAGLWKQQAFGANAIFNQPYHYFFTADTLLVRLSARLSELRLEEASPGWINQQSDAFRLSTFQAPGFIRNRAIEVEGGFEIGSLNWEQLEAENLELTLDWTAERNAYRVSSKNFAGGQAAAGFRFEQSTAGTDSLTSYFIFREVKSEELAGRLPWLSGKLPILQQMRGRFSAEGFWNTTLDVEGRPISSGAQGKMLISPRSLLLAGVPALDKIASETRILDLRSVRLAERTLALYQDQKRLATTPFTFEGPDNLYLTVFGEQSLSGTMNYKFRLRGFPEQLGVGARQTMASLPPEPMAQGYLFERFFVLRGTYLNPEFQWASAKTIERIKIELAPRPAIPAQVDTSISSLAQDSLRLVIQQQVARKATRSRLDSLLNNARSNFQLRLPANNRYRPRRNSAYLPNPDAAPTNPTPPSTDAQAATPPEENPADE